MTSIYPNNSPPPSPFPHHVESSTNYEVHHEHLLFTSPSQASSSSSLSFPIFFNPNQDQVGTFDRQEDHQEVINKYCILPGGSSISSRDHHQFIFQSPSLIPNPVESTDHETNYGGGLKLSLSSCKQEAEDHNKDHDDHHNPIEIGSSVKWMSSKMRLMRKMMNNPNRIVSDTTATKNKFDNHHHHQESSSLIFNNTDNSTNNYSSKYNTNNYSAIRVCADCNTTKTPLWRSGPRGPKSLCNACGIRQRKARRAMAAAAAAAANDTAVVLATDHHKESPSSSPTMKTKGSVVHHQKEMKIKRSSENGYNITQYKKRCKIVAHPAAPGSSSSSSGRKKLCFEDFTISLMSKNNSTFHHQVFPQDEKEAAILLMALSCGLVHG